MYFTGHKIKTIASRLFEDMCKKSVYLLLRPEIRFRSSLYNIDQILGRRSIISLCQTPVKSCVQKLRLRHIKYILGFS